VPAWVSEELGLDEYFAEVLPRERAEKIREIKLRGYVVAMVGNGVNDPPALARADVGIGAGILLTPAVGAFLISLSTVIVAVNAQLLRV
jgi:P-type E1-E2 ATPase